MSHLESLERKLREMSENGNSAPMNEDSGAENSSGDANSNSGNGVMCDLKIPRKFLRVLGYDGRTNDLVYCKPLSTTEDEEISVDSDSSTTNNVDARQKCLVYFGGDMQVSNLLFMLTPSLIDFDKHRVTSNTMFL